jgi:hypothetical protein
MTPPLPPDGEMDRYRCRRNFEPGRANFELPPLGAFLFVGFGVLFEIKLLPAKTAFKLFFSFFHGLIPPV